MRKYFTILLLAALMPAVMVADELATVREGTPVPQNIEPDMIPQVIDEEAKAKRNYPMQPPLIPHDTRSYEVNLQVNQCMACHARRRTAESMAPMISVTHYMDRDGNFLAEISPRRYFCKQCHVTQTDSRPMVDSDFVDMDVLLEQLNDGSRPN